MPTIPFIDRLPRWSNQSVGVSVVLALLFVSWSYLAFRPVRPAGDIIFWIFADSKQQFYEESVESWNDRHDEKVTLRQMGNFAIMQRMRAGFFAGTPMADLIELHPLMMRGIFSGPLQAVGFTDLTERLHLEGLYEQINEPSLAPWTYRGRIFGMPTDVAPMLLAYRADIVEEAGIDMESIETWDDFFSILRPLVKDLDGDGFPDRYLLEMDDGPSGTLIEVLVLQAGGHYFDEREQPIINSKINARVLSKIALWGAEPNRLTADVPLWSATNHRLLVEGYIVAWLTPDWRNRVMKLHMSALSGKVKLMPIPAWEEGGRRTSVYGGSMIGIPKSSDRFGISWQFLKSIRFDREAARRLYREAEVITPVKTFWDDPIYDEPDPFFANQAKGRIYIRQAPNLPMQTSSPYNERARMEVGIAAKNLRAFAEDNRITAWEDLLPRARELLAEAETNLRLVMERNVFVDYR